MTPKALRWRQRRGMKELDVLLERYYTRHYDSASQTERKMFARLLEREDPEIWLWIVGQAAPPGEREAFARLLEREDPEIWLWIVGQETPPPEFINVIAALQRHD